MSEKLDVISVLGPLGSGKTTAINKMVQCIPPGENYAVIVNDVGKVNVDAQRFMERSNTQSERIIPLTAGCIGCSDVTQFKEALERVQESDVGVLFIEPTGIAPGSEILEVVGSYELPVSVLTLVNPKTLTRDLKWQSLPSQIAAATRKDVTGIIGVTHVPDDADVAEVMNSVLTQLPVMPDDVAIELLRPGQTDYDQILAELRGTSRQLALGRRAVDICCGHHHHHDHHDHGVSAKSFELLPEVAVDELKGILLPLTHNDQTPLLRAKGAISGVGFDISGNEWTEYKLSEDAEPVVNVIFGGHFPAEVLGQLQHLSVQREQLVMDGSKKEIVGSVGDLSVADRTAIIAESLQYYPAPISSVHGGLITDCEADNGYEVAFWRPSKKGEVPDDIKRKAMEGYIAFRLAGVDELTFHSDNINGDEVTKNYWHRRYGATLGFNGYFLSEYILPDQLAAIRSYNPAKHLAEGFLALDSLTFDEGRAEEKPEFIAKVLGEASKRGDISEELYEAVLSHAQHLAKTNEDFYMRWSVVSQ